MIWTYAPLLIAALLFIIQFILGIINSHQVHKVHDFLLAEARKRSRRSFTIVTPLNRRAETIFPLLDHLRGFNHKDLQVIVVVRQTAGSNARRQLERYRHQFNLKLTIVKHRRALTDQAVVKRYATGNYIMKLNNTDRLGAKFFDVVSQILYSNNFESLIIRDHLRPRQTFLMAANSIRYLFKNIVAMIGIKRTSRPSHLLMKRKAFVRGSNHPVRAYLAEQVYVDTTLSEAKPKTTTSFLMTAALLGVGLVAGYFVYGRYAGFNEAAVFGAAILASIMACIIIAMSSLRGFKLIDYVNLALFVPLLPLYAVIQLVYIGAKKWIFRRPYLGHRVMKNRAIYR